jgi:hypothetical protein
VTAPTGEERRSFAANLVTPRTVLIFAAGFLVALFLARVLPDAGLFHPEGRVVTVDTVITSSMETSRDVAAIVTEDGKTFEVPLDMLSVLGSDPFPTTGAMRQPARITYVVPREGSIEVVLIRPPE